MNHLQIMNYMLAEVDYLVKNGEDIDLEKAIAIVIDDNKLDTSESIELDNLCHKELD